MYRKKNKLVDTCFAKNTSWFFLTIQVRELLTLLQPQTPVPPCL
jgi:hypothetical protein